MIIIVNLGRTIAKFESFEGYKAMDWITEKGLYRKERVYVDNNALWLCEPLPKVEA